MRTRIAIASMLVALFLLGTALVRYVTARDSQRLEPAEPLRDIPVIVGLLAAGTALGAGGAMALARWSRPALMTLGGAILLGTAGILYVFACDTRRQEQAVLDRQWAEAARRAARRFPPALPEARPAPAPLRGLPMVLGLLVGGVILCGRGVAVLMIRSGSPRHSPHDDHE